MNKIQLLNYKLDNNNIDRSSLIKTYLFSQYLALNQFKTISFPHIISSMIKRTIIFLSYS